MYYINVMVELDFIPHKKLILNYKFSGFNDFFCLYLFYSKL